MWDGLKLFIDETKKKTTRSLIPYMYGVNITQTERLSLSLGNRCSSKERLKIRMTAKLKDLFKSVHGVFQVTLEIHLTTIVHTQAK